MKTGARKAAVAFAAFAALGAVATYWSSTSNGPAPPEAVRAVQAIPPPPPRAVPEPLAEVHRAIRDFQAKREWKAAAERYPELLQGLASAWGDGNADLAPYGYEFALALKLAGSGQGSLAVAREGLRRWPASFPLLAIEAVVRAEIALERGISDPGAIDGLAALLTGENHPRLLGMRIEREALCHLRSELLLRALRPAEALQIAEDGLKGSVGSLRLREVRARALLALERHEEALPLLRDAVAARPSPELELGLALAEIESGEAGLAWGRLSRLRNVRPAAASPGVESSLQAGIRLQGGRALNRLALPREAAELLIELLEVVPESVPALHELAAAARTLGAKEGLDAINARTKSLIPRERSATLARHARAAGHPASALFYEAQADLAIGRAGDAIEKLNEAAKIAPRLARVRLEISRVRLLSGRPDLALHELEEATRQSGTAAGSPAGSRLLRLETARFLAAEGDSGRGRILLAEGEAPADGEKPMPGGSGPEAGIAEKEAVEEPLVHLRRARALLALGDTARAREILASTPPEGETAAEAALCRAEAAVREGKTVEAREQLDGTFEDLPDGPSWAAALRALLDAAEGKPPPDPSDLLDRPDLLNAAQAAPAALEKARTTLARRREVFARMRGRPDAELAAERGEMFALYREAGAARKARETAWCLVHLHPASGEDRRRLVEALDAPEELITRLSAAREGLKFLPGDPFLEKAIADARAALGLAKP